MYCPACRSDYPSDWKACPKDATALLRSAQIGKYTIDGLLGVGGMGAVYRAINPDTRGRVAIKLMNPAVAGSEHARQRFQREAAAVAALSTTHVCKVYDFGNESDGTLYLVMELMQGHALRDEIHAPPHTMDLARVQMVMDGALRGLVAAHKAGIVHRDLKPENVFVAATDDGEVPKLLDFGIARVRTRDSDLTRTGAMMGTASYMAPEQVAAQAELIGPWSDVYAMGTILYEMLSGLPAFGGETLTEVLGRVMRSELEPLSKVRPGLPAAVYALVEQCMALDTKARPADGEALRAAMAHARLVAIGTPVPAAQLISKSADAGLDATLGVPAGAGAAATRAAPSVTPTHKLTHREGAPADDLGTARPARKRWPFAVLGLVVLGTGGALVARSLKGSTQVAADAQLAGSRSDAREVAAVADASLAIDASVDPHATMVAIKGGTYDIGEAKAQGDALRRRRVTVGEFWIDRHEMTVGELATLLGDKLPAETRTRTAADAPTTPTRFVDWATARAACEAAGKRLPTEAEWEVAALTTPQDPARARLRRNGDESDLIAHGTDCSDAGLCDMLGSLLEWTADDVPKHRGDKIVRGASYKVFQDGQLDSIHGRNVVAVATTDNELGFRCVSGGQR